MVGRSNYCFPMLEPFEPQVWNSAAVQVGENHSTVVGLMVPLVFIATPPEVILRGYAQTTFSFGNGPFLSPPT